MKLNGEKLNRSSGLTNGRKSAAVVGPEMTGCLRVTVPPNADPE